MCPVFLKFNGVVVGITGAVLGAIQHLAIAGHSSSAEVDSSKTLKINLYCLNKNPEKPR